MGTLFRKMEDQWYKILDKVDPVIPVYRIIDPIDKVVPSFLLLVGAALLIAIWFSAAVFNIGGLGGLSPFAGNPTHGGLTILVASTGDLSPLSGVLVKIENESLQLEKISGADGKILLSDIPVGEPLTLSASGEGFESTQKKVSVTQGGQTIVLSLEELHATPEAWDIILADEANQLILGKQGTASVTCGNGNAVPIQTNGMKEGYITVSPTVSCTEYFAQISLEGHVPLSHVAVSPTHPSVTLQPLTVPMGKIKLALFSPADQHLSGMRVQAFTLQNSLVEQTYSNALGLAILSLPAGDYYFSISDEHGTYGTHTTSTISIPPNLQKEESIVMQLATVGKLEISVTEKGTAQPIADALVRVIDTKTDTIVFESQTHADGKTIPVGLTTKGPFLILVQHENYLYVKKQIQWEGNGTQLVPIELTLATNENSGIARVTVVNEEGVPISGASVQIIEPANGSKAAVEWPTILTNGMGKVEWKGLMSGNYLVRASKGFFGPVETNVFALQKGEPYETTLTLIVGKGTVNVEVLDEELKAIPLLPTISFRTIGGLGCAADACAVQAGTKGEGSYTLNADQLVYVRVSAPGYISLQTAEYSLIPGKAITIRPILRKIETHPSVEMELEKIVSTTTGMKLTELKAGEKYTALFRVYLKPGDTWNGGGVHIREGLNGPLSEDGATILSIRAGDASIQKGTTYQPLAGWSIDADHFTQGKAKWVEGRWMNMEGGDYWVEIDLEVNPFISPLQSVPLSYRAWGINASNQYERSPLDPQLGGAENSPFKNGFYADTHTQNYVANLSTQCNVDVCVSGETFTEKGSKTLLTTPLLLKAGNEYVYQFVLVAGNTSTLSDVKLGMNLGGEGSPLPVVFTDYTLEILPDGLVEGHAFTSSFIPENGVPLALGKMEPGQVVLGTVVFSTQQSGASTLSLRVTDGTNLLLETKTSIQVQEGKSLLLSASPEILLPFVSENVTFSLTDELSTPIGDSPVSIYRNNGGVSALMGVWNTSPEGKIAFQSSTLWPGEYYYLIAQKKEYNTATLTLPVTNQPVLVQPTHVQAALPLVANAKISVPITVQNKSATPLVLSSASLTLDSGAWLNHSQIKQSLNTWKETPLPSQENVSISLVIQTKSTVKITQTQIITGTLAVQITNPLTNQTWVAQVPVTVTLNPLTGCETGGIILEGLAPPSLDLKPFQQQAEATFQLYQSCMTGETNVSMRNLKAKLEWEDSSHPLGHVELSLTDPITQKELTQVLKEKYAPFSSTFVPATEGKYEGVIRFTPEKPLPGKQGKIILTIAGEIGNPEAPITVTHTIPMSLTLNPLETCVKYSPEPGKGINIRSKETSKEFRIDTSSCEMPVEVAFCLEKNNDGCSGGAPAGKISVTPGKKTIQGDTPFTVKRTDETLPGSYDVTLFARTPGIEFEKIGRMEVKVHATKEYAFDMTKTTYTVIGKKAADTTLVLNRLFKEKLAVKSPVCNWIKSVAETDEAFWYGQAAGTITSFLLATVLNTFVLVAIEGIATALGASIFAPLVANLLGGTLIASAAGSLVSGVPVVGELLGTIVEFLLTCPICVIIGIIIALLVTLALAEEVDLCEIEYTQEDMDDYVIHLKGIEDDGDEILDPDALDIQLSNNVKGLFSAEWVLEQDVISGEDEETEEKEDIQVVGAKFTNQTGYANETPLFGIATLRATEHIHGDADHEGEGEVTCKDGTFQNFNVGPGSDEGSCEGAEDVTREEPFHVKFKTAEGKQPLPYPLVNSTFCSTGPINGGTGEYVLPKVAYNWRWDPTYGVPLFACDASNTNGIYCDATQLNIDIMKRMRALEGFLEANNYTFACPTDPNAQPGSVQKLVNDEIEKDSIGVKTVGYEITKPNEITFSMNVENQTLFPQDSNLSVYMLGGKSSVNPGGLNQTTLFCSATGAIQTGKGMDYSCTIPNIPSDTYVIVMVLGKPTNLADPTQVLPWEKIQSPTQFLAVDLDNFSYGSSGLCDQFPKSTKIIGGTPAINRWMDAGDEDFGQFVNEDNVIFTPEVPDVDTLNKLTHFGVYLMADGYSTDFENDFRKYYAQTTFADAPTWFKGTDTKGYQSFYGDDDRLAFVYKYTDQSATLQTPGTYAIDIDVDISGDDWKFFDEQGNPKVTIKAEMYLLDTPVVNSPFYRLPIDGELGLEGDQLHRKGYGVEYVHQNGTISINDSFIETHNDSHPDGGVVVNTFIESEFKNVNSVPLTRGRLLHVNAPTGTGDYEMVFSPMQATPILMRVTQPEATDKPFSTFYQLSQSGKALEIGESALYWNGTSACTDFSGIASSEAFVSKPDRRATQNDKLTNWQYVYGLDWPSATQGGNVYLKTIIYTPTNDHFTLASETPNVRFLASNYAGYSSLQVLDGVTSIQHNNVSKVIDSLQDVFDLVKSGDLCLYDNGIQADFYWNEDQLYAGMGATTIEKEINQLVPGQTCIAETPTQNNT